MDFSDLTNDDLLDKLSNGAAIDQLENSEGWHLVKEACKRRKRAAQEALKDIDPTDASGVMQLQQIVKLYGEEFIPSLINSFRQEGEMAFEELREKGVIERG